MTLSDFQRAMLAAFAARESGIGASLEEMKAIAYCVRNRVRQGWHGGNWLANLENADQYRGNLKGPHIPIDADSRPVQRLVREIDDIYFGLRESTNSPQAQTNGIEDSIGKCCYWLRANEPFSPWFVEKIIHDPDHHPLRMQMGTLYFYE